MPSKQVEDPYNSRRIRPDQQVQDTRSKLKTIAGLIQGLSYREMITLAGYFEGEVRSESYNDFPAILLKVSERIQAP